MEVLDEVGVGICGGIFRELACLPGRGPGICRYSNGRKTADEIPEQDRQDGRVLIPADVVQQTGSLHISVYGENRYGRLSNRHTLTVVD